jgi:tetratricopeptide (TPR) repeat protein
MFDKFKLDSVLQEIVTSWEIPGLSVGIIRDGGIAYAKRFGVQNLETNIPVTSDSIFCIDESFSIYRVQRAVLDAMLGHEPKVGTVSWAVPVCRALEKVGTEAAYACYEEIKDQKDVYSFDAEFLTFPALHSMTVNKIEIAIALLELNLHVFPDHAESFYYLARACLKKGDCKRAEENLGKALKINPDFADQGL